MVSSPRHGSGRRRWIAAALGAGALGALALARPADRGAGHAGYFGTLQSALRAAGIAQPTIVVDRERLQRNLARIGARAAANGLPLRVVVKSLPCPALLDAALAAWRTDRLMLFNAPQLREVASRHPHARLLLGKPLPAAAAQALLGPLRDALERIEWLVDTPARLEQYRELARAAGVTLQLNIEIDVGLHRGGVGDPPTLAAMLATLRDEPRLRWSGLMGYDAHVLAVPDLAGGHERAIAAMRARYAALWQAAAQVLPQQARRDALTLNTGGSPTFHLHDRGGLPNEVAVGSAALKPGDFDLPSLAELEPAVFIAAPLLKDLGTFRLPEGAGGVSALAAAWDPNQRRAFAIHGGHWAADVVSPSGLAPSGLFGTSANQQVMVGSPAVALAPDDFVFFRPRHSEAVLLQFGDLAIVEAGRVVAMAPVFPASA